MTYTYFKGKSEEDQKLNIKIMMRYFRKKFELDKLLYKLAAPYLRGKELEVMDACCGIGHISLELAQRYPRSRFVGIDQTPYLIDQAIELKQQLKLKNCYFFDGDVLEMKPKCADLTIFWKTISWIPSYEQMLLALIGGTRSHIFLSGLFYDEGDVDFSTTVRSYGREVGKDEPVAIYNTYSLPRFKKWCKAQGVKRVKVYDFEIPIDLPKKHLGQIGTYTQRLANGRRLQVSGAMLMLWKVIRLDL
jgi:SAM-dependent methyltransferase